MYFNYFNQCENIKINRMNIKKSNYPTYDLSDHKKIHTCNTLREKEKRNTNCNLCYCVQPLTWHWSTTLTQKHVIGCTVFNL